MADTNGPKEEEKAQEKEEEKRDEKNFDEKWRSNPLGALTWAGILIWAGLVLLAKNLGLLARLEPLQDWNLIMAGAGVILLIEVLIRLNVPAYRRPVAGTLVFGLVLLGAGLGSIKGWDLIWPLLLIAGGIAMLFGFMSHRR